MDAAQIRLAQPAPPHCSACFGAKPNMRHVDFGAAWDGPMLPALEGAIGVVAHSIDDLVICEECLRTGGKIVGLTDNSELEAANAQLEAANAQLHARIEQYEREQKAVESLRAALNEGTVTPLRPRGENVTPMLRPGPPAGARGRQKGKKPAGKA
jgi:hypothetical protein